MRVDATSSMLAMPRRSHPKIPASASQAEATTSTRRTTSSRRPLRALALVRGGRIEFRFRISASYRGLNNYQYYSGGSFSSIIV